MSASRARLWDHIYGFSERHLSIEGQELPTAGLSPAMMREVYRELARMKHSHAITVLLVEQNVREALAVADHVYSLVMGENDCHGPADEMRERLDEIVRGWMSRAGSGVVARRRCVTTPSSPRSCWAAALSAAGLPATAADVIILSAYFLLLASSWNLLAGYTGQYSFAHVGLAAVGGYGAALVVFALGAPLWAAFVIVPVATGLVGDALGLVALRVCGIQLPLITFAFAGAFAVWLSAASTITGGSMGMQLPRLFEGASRAPYLILAGVLCAIYFWLQNRILDGRLGLRWPPSATARRWRAASASTSTGSRFWRS